MGLNLVTGYKGRNHVTAEQWADFNRGIYGEAAILPVGSEMAVTIQTGNQITIKDGVAVFDGREIYIGYGESESITIPSGTQGTIRNDIVVVKYARNEENGTEEVAFEVVSGTPATSNPQDPDYQDTDIRTGVFVSQKPFCRVRINEAAIESVVMLVPVKEFQDVAFSGSYNDLSNRPTSMKANGGNADTVGGKSAAELQNYNNLTNRPSSLPASGGNADTVDGKHASDLQNYNNLINRPTSMEANGGNADTVGGKSAATLQNYNNLTNKPTLGGAASQKVANNLTTNVAGSVLDARQGKALNDKITSAQSGLSALTGRIAAGLHMDHFLIGSGQGILYLRLQKTDWNKAYAFIIGCRNVDYILSESIYAWYDATQGKIRFFAEGPMKANWSADQSSGGSNVQLNLPENSQGIIIWYGFQQIGTA